MKRSGELWTDDEIMYLEERWGMSSRKNIAKKLKRTTTSVQLKAQRLGLGDPLHHLDGITLNQLANILNTHYGIISNWQDKYSLPVQERVVAKSQSVKYIAYDDFWKWAEQNKQMLDLSRLGRLSIGPEPDWVETKRKADELKRIHKPKPHNTPWTSNDIEKLKWMLSRNRYTYVDIAKELQRSQGAIKRKIYELKINKKPIRANKNNKYSKEEENKIVEMLIDGYCFEVIANHLGEHRSALGVRGKVERMGYKFKNGVPYIDQELVTS